MTFEVGQLVTVIEHYSGEPQGIRKVAKVGVRKMTLDNGSEWRPDGQRMAGYAGDRWYTGPYLKPFEECDRERLERRKAVYRIENFHKWKELTTEELRIMAEILGRHTEVTGAPA